MTEILSASHVSASYGGIIALRDVSVTLHESSLVCVIGSNGAGKSTLMNCISGVVQVTSGEITYRDAKLSGLSVERISAMRVLQVPEGRRVLAPLTVRDNLLLGASPTRLTAAQERASLEDVYNLFPILERRSGQLAGSLSGGEQQMLAIGRALMGQPEVLLLDEPSLGLAPVIVSEVYAALAELKGQGLSMLIVEQNARLALRVSDYGYVLQRGRVVAEGDSSKLLKESSLADLYLGRERHNAAAVPDGTAIKEVGK